MADLFAKKPFSILAAEAREQEGLTLKRSLGPYSLVALGIGATVGTGIFFVPDIIARFYAGPAVIVCFILAAVVSLLGALCYAEIASMIPIAGSAYTYAYASLGEIFAWVIGWTLILEYVVAAAAVAGAWGHFVQDLLRNLGLSLPYSLTGHFGEPYLVVTAAGQVAQVKSTFNILAVLIIILVSAILIRGIRESAAFSALGVQGKLAALLIFVGISAKYAFGHSDLIARNVTPFLPAEFGWTGIFAGSTVAFFCFSGLDSISTSAQESRRPDRDIPVALIFTVCICSILYVVVSGLLVGIVPYQELGTGLGLVWALKHIGSGAGRIIVEIGGILGLTSGCLVLLLGASRTVFSMSHDGLLWKWAGRIHPRFRTVWIANIVIGCIAAVLAGLAPVRQLVTLASVGSLFTFAVVCLSVFVLRQRRPDVERPFRVPGGKWTAAIGAASSLILLGSVPSRAGMALLVWGVFGLLIYFSYGRAHSTVAVRSTSRLRTDDAIKHESKEEFDIPELADPPSELIRACTADECVVVVGTGISAQAGYPAWASLVQELLEWSLERKLVDESSAASLRTAIRAGDSNSVIDAIVHSRGDARAELCAHLRDVFFERKNPSAVHNAIAAINFAGILNASFDRLLEQLLHERGIWRSLTSSDGERLLAMLTTREKFIVKLYGDLERTNTVLLGREDYSDTVAPNSPFAQFMDSLFFSRTLVFIGTSLQGLEDYVKTNFVRHGANVQTSKTHFALVPIEDASWRAKANVLRRRYSIQVIPYHPTQGHPELLTFLRRLESLIQVERNQQAGGTPLETQPIRRVILKNVGAFKELEMTLDQSWNVLLGDNGVGKSTILKALALAISGKDAEPFASRLISSRENEASIILEVASRTYTVTLTRNGDAADVKAFPPVRPLEAEGWLALGFPPLRNATWGTTKLISPSSSERPKTSDLLPLVAGDLDPRVDRLKEWLVGLDYQIKDLLNSNKDASREQRLFAAVFQALDALTPGVTVKFKEVVAKTLRIMVQTDDGVVPVEAVSQGTMSLMSWVGILVQRMYEIYGDMPGIDPIKQFAIVIVDEIDAHMHPKWQQLIVGSLKKLFPKVQFIATTHSPLIVVGLGPEAVFLVRRDQDNRNRVTVQRPSIEMKGWRADQMLTGPLFNLTTSMDLHLFEKTKRFTQLAARPDLNRDQQKELECLSAELHRNLPTSEEREDARLAFEVLEKSIDDQLKALPRDRQQAILEEVRSQLQQTSDFRKSK